MVNCKDNPYTFGIIIGGTCSIISFIIYLFSVFFFFTGSGGYELMLIFLTCTVISGLFVLAIIKKAPHLIIPWLLLCITVVHGSCFALFAFYSFVLQEKEFDSSNKKEMAIFIVGSIIIAIEIAITVYSFRLYFKLLKENCSRRNIKSPNESPHLTDIQERSFV